MHLLIHFTVILIYIYIHINNAYYIFYSKELRLGSQCEEIGVGFVIVLFYFFIFSIGLVWSLRSCVYSHPLVLGSSRPSGPLVPLGGGGAVGPCEEILEPHLVQTNERTSHRRNERQAQNNLAPLYTTIQII